MTNYKKGMKIYCCLLKSDKNFFLQSEHDGSVVFFPTEEKAISFWEKGYENAYSRGLCGATGAMLTYMMCQPSVVSFDNEDKMIKSLFKKPPYSTFSFMSYSIRGIQCQKNVEKLWKNGIKPKLIEIT